MFKLSVDLNVHKTSLSKVSLGVVSGDLESLLDSDPGTALEMRPPLAFSWEL